jgi:DNA-binding LacI/PurR family transcriptional regulator
MSDAHELATVLRHGIIERKCSPHEPFPSLNTIVRTHHCRLTVARAATNMLVSEGWLYRRPRSGTFVRGAPPADPGHAKSVLLRCITILLEPEGVRPSFVRMDYLHGYTTALDASDVRMRVMTYSGNPDHLASLLHHRYALTEQGCILVNIRDEPVLRWLTENKVSFVLQNHRQYARESLPPHHSVIVNKMGGSFRATQRLIELGHRQIGYIGDMTTPLSVYDGYVAALHCAGLEMRSSDCLPISPHEEHYGNAAQEAAARRMAEGDLPTAIVAERDTVAFGVLRAAAALGIRVPQDLSVMGFNNQAGAERSRPPLTTMAVPRVQLGRTAAETLLAVAAKEPQDPVSIVLECVLVERESVAPPGQQAPQAEMAHAGKKMCVGPGWQAPHSVAAL